jgi:hypothetical protein
MSKKLLSESQVNRWSKLANIKTGKKALNEMGMGHGMAYAREDEEEMAPEGDMGGEMDMGADAGMDMGGEEPMDMDLGAADAGPEEEMSLDDDKLMSMIKDAVKAALVDAGLSDEMEGGEEEMEMEEEGEEEGEEAEGEEAGEGGDELSAEPGEEEEDMEALQEVEVVTNDEVINETLKRVLARLRK